MNPYALSRWLSRAMSAVTQIPLALAVVASEAASAQTSAPVSPSAAWADPSAQVPPVVYRSVFADTPTGVETQSTDWKKANAEVGQFKRGHIDILKWEEAQTQQRVPTPVPSGVPDAAKPAAPGMHKH